MALSSLGVFDRIIYNVDGEDNKACLVVRVKCHKLPNTGDSNPMILCLERGKGRIVISNMPHTFIQV